MFVFPYLTYFSFSLLSLDPSMLLQMERLHFLMAEFYVVMYVCVYIYVTTSVSIYLLMRWLSCFRILAIVNKAAVNIEVYIFSN